MPAKKKKLNLAQQRMLVKMMSPSDKANLKSIVNQMEMGGAGFFDIVKSIGKNIAKVGLPILKEVGPTILKEIVLPMVKNKLAGNGKPKKGRGINIAGNGLKLAGNGCGCQKGRGRPAPRVFLA